MLLRQPMINPIIRDYYLISTKKSIKKIIDKCNNEKKNELLKLTKKTEFQKENLNNLFIGPFFGFLSITSMIYYIFKF